jgi:hypothetical protein
MLSLQGTLSPFSRCLSLIDGSEHVYRWILRIEPSGYFLCKSYYNYADTLMDLLESSSAPAERKALKKRAAFAVKLFSEYKKNFKFSEFWFLLVQGKWFWLNTKYSKAKDNWQLALQLSHLHNNVYEETVALMHLGLHSLTVEEKQQHLSAAQKLVELIESPFDATVIKRELRSNL